MVYGIVATFILADNPLQAHWLEPRERDIAVMRLRSNGTGIHNSAFKLDHVKEVLLDPQVYALIVAAFGIAFCNAAFSRYVDNYVYCRYRAILTSKKLRSLDRPVDSRP